MSIHNNDILKTTNVETLKDVYRHMEAPDLDFVQDKVLDFFKNQKLKNAIVFSMFPSPMYKKTTKILRNIDK